MKYNDQQFIELALQYKYVTQADVDKCLEIQKKLPGQVGIGEIMRSHKQLEDAEYNIIMTLLKYKTGPAARIVDPQPAVDSRARDRHFAEAALREGMINEEQLKESVELQKRMAREGQAKPLSAVMLSRGYITEKQFEFLEDNGAEVTSQYKREDVMRIMQEKNVRKNLEETTIAPTPEDPISCLVIRQGDKEIGIFSLDNKTEISIGRVQGADLVLNDCYVSRIHCKFIYHDKSRTWEVIDMMSCHGVFINGVRMSHRQTVKKGDLIRVGETLLEVN